MDLQRAQTNYVNYLFIRLAGIFLGIPLILLSFYHLSKVYEEKTWPWTIGVVSRSEVFTRRLLLDVPFRVGSANYVCHRIRYGQTPAPSDRYRYYVGASAKIYYNPQKPESCVLEPEVAGSFPLLWVTGFALVACGIFAHSKIKRIVGSQPAILSSPSYSAGTSCTLDAVRELALSGRTIDAIKAYREITGIGLKEAKNYVDNLARTQRLKQ